MKGQIIGGDFSSIIIRQKEGKELEIGELLVSENNFQKMIFQVFDLEYASQLSKQNLELISGMQLEEDSDLDFFDKSLRNYVLAKLKNLAIFNKSDFQTSKKLPNFFSNVREPNESDFSFLHQENNPLFLGKIRSGSKSINFDVFIDGKEALSHHILVCASTGKGKSNLVKSMLWNLVDKDYCGVLVLDPHDEYYGKNSVGLKNHVESRVVYYTPRDALPGTKTLKISLYSVKPIHFKGVVNFSEPQQQAMYAYYKEYKQSWIEAAVLEKKLPDKIRIHEESLNVLRRNLITVLNLDVGEDNVKCHGIFDNLSGESTVFDIVSELENSLTVIIDTSSFTGNVELLVGSIISSEIFGRYRGHKYSGTLNEKPTISIVLEEAPRVIGKSVLEKGSNIFSSIAREGRKFKIGLLAITQLPSLIPRDILANMNTKIILGMEMRLERDAIIDSSAQDLSSDDKNIASLDKGEAIVTSTFLKFATPIKIPLFESLLNQQKKEHYKQGFSGIELIDT